MRVMGSMGVKSPLHSSSSDLYREIGFSPTVRFCIWEVTHRGRLTFLKDSIRNPSSPEHLFRAELSSRRQLLVRDRTDAGQRIWIAVGSGNRACHRPFTKCRSGTKAFSGCAISERSSACFSSTSSDFVPAVVLSRMLSASIAPAMRLSVYAVSFWLSRVRRGPSKCQLP